MNQTHKKTSGEQEIAQTKEEECFFGDELDGEEEFEFVNTGGENKEDDEFDEVVGALQDLVLDPEFEEQQNEFLDRNCDVFEDDEENKIEYTQIFQDYQDKLETYIELKLKEAKPDLDMVKFMGMMETRIDEIDPQLQDLLLSFTDFQLFKEHMLAHKKQTLSVKKKSKKFEESKQEKAAKKNQMTSLEQDLGDMLISGQGKEYYTEKFNKVVKEEKPLSKNIANIQENTSKEVTKKGEPQVDDGAKFTHKKSSAKANPEYKTQKKANIFS